MSETFINLHIRYEDSGSVATALSGLFAAEGFNPAGQEPAREAVDADEALDDDAYGVVAGGPSGAGWVSIYVDDWVDSGWIAKKLTAALNCWGLEIWQQNESLWGYTLYDNGKVEDRFADDPYAITDDPNEAALYAGDHEKFAPILAGAGEKVRLLLDKSQEDADRRLASAHIADLADDIGLPYEHALMGLDDFFEEDPDDYAQDLENWEEFQFLTFQCPSNRQTLAT